MEPRKFKLYIVGDYVDSYIYSGHLFLVDINYNLTVYKWNTIFNVVGYGDALRENRNIIRDLILDSRKFIPNLNINELTVSEEALKKAKLSTFNIGVWPSDISIFSNNMYISSEKGVLRLKFDYNDGTLNNEVRIYDEMSFSLSPNSWGRLAFAAGRSGALTFIPNSKFVKNEDIRQVVPNVCLDVDWQSTNLVANTVDGVFRASYREMPDKNKFKVKYDYFKEVDRIKNRRPELEKKYDQEVAWNAGDKTYSLNKSGQVIIENLRNKENNRGYIYPIVNKKIIKARTAAFGTIFETEDSLFGLIGDHKMKLADENVNWRVFPRARNYANQLHTIFDDRLEITIIESPKENMFGFDTEQIDLRG